jgi:hypothetical protein
MKPLILLGQYLAASFSTIGWIVLIVGWLVCLWHGHTRLP